MRRCTQRFALLLIAPAGDHESNFLLESPEYQNLPFFSVVIFLNVRIKFTNITMEYVIDHLRLGVDKSLGRFPPDDSDNDGEGNGVTPDHSQQRRKSYYARFPDAEGSPYLGLATF